LDRDLPILRSGVIHISDELSAVDLAVPVELIVSSSESVRLQSGESATVPPLGPDSSLRYQLLDSTQIDVPAEGRITFADSTWTIRIPYNCRVAVSVSAEKYSFIDSQSELRVLQHPQVEVHGEAVDPASIAALAQPQLNDSTFHGMMNRTARKERASLLQLPCGDQVIPPFLVPAQGTYVMGLFLSDGTAAYAPLELVPGTEVEVFVDLRLRPLLTGVLLDWHGEPVPNEEVVFSTSLDMLDYDLSPRDGAGLAALRVNGMMHQTTKYSVSTDAGGRFSVRVPRGSEYCVESNARGSRAFWSTRDAGIVLGDHAEIELRLEDPEAETAIHFEILRANGAPLSGAEAQVSVGDDIPFIRQWPRKRLDDKGLVGFLGLEPGEVFSLLLFHPSLQRAIYVPEKLVVPNARRITIVVPDAAFIH
jgi:hypothetical protein